VDPLKERNVFLRRQEPSPAGRTGLLPAQEHDSVCGNGWFADGSLSAKVNPKRTFYLRCQLML